MRGRVGGRAPRVRTPLPSELVAWRSFHRRHADGAVDTVQLVRIRRPLVELSDAGARLLGRRYWTEVTRASRGLVRCRDGAAGVELLAVPLRPPLLNLSRAGVDVEVDRVSCRYTVQGGLLARRPGGTLVLAHTSRELCVAVRGFVPRLGALYAPFQRRFHVAVSRRFAIRLALESRR
jgi:hypothetical protein